MDVWWAERRVARWVEPLVGELFVMKERLVFEWAYWTEETLVDVWAATKERLVEKKVGM